MANEIFLQNWIFTKFALPFLLIFFIVFAILEKTKVFGEEKKQLNALVAFVIGLIFVGFAFPKEFLENMILFLTVALVVVFVTLMLWGFIGGSKEGFELEGWMKYSLFGISSVALIAAVLWASGVHNNLIDLLFYQNWSSTFWTNVLFIAAIAAALALVLKNKGSS
jgi:hypothetical protein|tara:strand:+ start:1313 stop:1810 length:498 start_codon:yes stop_codon:yes gene_type:complete